MAMATAITAHGRRVAAAARPRMATSFSLALPRATACLTSPTSQSTVIERRHASSVALPPRLEGKVALVTGGGGGIGRATALLMAQNGAAGVVVADVAEEAALETVALVEAAAGPGSATYVRTDVTDSDAVAAAVATAERTYGSLNVLFNNAGIMHSDDDNAVTTTDAVWDLTMAINVKGVLYGCRHGIPALRRAGGGSIINTASFVAKVGAATPQLAYTASKGAVLAMTRELAVLHAREGIRVNALCPGPLHTELLMAFLDTEEKKQRRLVHVPMGRFGHASEMATAVVFLASDESSFVTGTDFMVDGGLTAAYVTPE